MKPYYDPKQALLDQAHTLVQKAAAIAMENGTLPKRELPAFITEVPADSKNGDVASNFAMAGARTFSMPPIKIAQAIIDAMPDLSNTSFLRAEIAGPGFINLFACPSWFSSVVFSANHLHNAYGKTQYGQGKKVNVEFVSANPTGPMHLGNARGGALGDCLCAVLDWAGYQVTKEFLINDAGNQVLKFGKSLATRYLQIYLGEENVPFPEDGYQGDDIKELAHRFADIHGDSFVTRDFGELQEKIAAFGLPINIQALKDHLAKYRVEYDVWFHESTLHQNGAIQDALAKLAANGATYEKDGAIWYRSMKYAEKYGANKVSRKGLAGEVSEEEKDEVLVRANGIPTYFAADIAYHYNKFTVRHFDSAINVWGADHHAHVARLKGAMDAIGLDGEKLDIILMQFVRLTKDGQPVRMSKRTGKAIGLSELLDEVPVDSARFLFNMREPGSTIDFDLDLAIKKDSDNPVYYVQYAHARICSILKKLAQEGIALAPIEEIDLSLLTHSAERDLIRMIGAFPSEIITAAKSYDPARITRYTMDLATCYHKFYNACRVKESDPALCQARLALCTATKNVIFNALTMMKITIPESM